MAGPAVLFDLYGTLLVPNELTAPDATYEAMEGTSFARVLGLSGAALKAFCNGVLAAPAQRSRDDDFTIYEGRLYDHALLRGATVSSGSVREAADCWVGAWQKGWTLDDQAREVIGALRSRAYSTALVTNFDHWPHIEGVVREHSLAELFDVIVVSSAVGYFKPDPRIFDHALEALGVSAGDAGHVGDDDVDVLGAQAAGVAPVRIDRAGHRDEPGVACIQSLRELLDLYS
jgi:FMN phosphatase YigB (HAD superfamily)